jgi:glutamine amidotransferase
MKVAIVNYGMGNLGSIQNMIKRAGHEAVVTSDATEISQADRLILPGVGAFDLAMQNIRTLGLKDLLVEQALEKRKPILGICLGMQILGKGSEEGILPGLGWIDAVALKFSFPPESRFRVPHMGWNVILEACDTMLFRDFSVEKRFYFLHSYYMVCDTPSSVIGITEYGHKFCCAIQKGNVFGVQFHPEKSHRFGMRLLKNFIEASC